MNDAETRRYETFLRVREFNALQQAQIPAASLASELFTRLDTAINNLDTHATAKTSAKSTELQGSRSKSVARDNLYSMLDAISRTARSMAMTMPGLESKFRRPRKVKDQELLSIARSFQVDATPLKTEFIRRGMAQTFLEDLDEAITEFEQSVTQKIQGQEGHVAANAAIDDLIEEGINILRELDPVMRNLFAADPATLAAWLSASHVERPPKTQRKKAQKETQKTESGTSAPSQP